MAHIYTDGIHIITDGEVSDLHRFAAKLNLNRCWFDANPRHPHYDFPKSLRNNDKGRSLALYNGAIVCDEEEFMEVHMKIQRAKGRIPNVT